MTLLELLQLLKKHLRLVIVLPLVCALAMGVYSYAFMKSTYTSSVSMYVLAQNSQETTSTTLYSDLNASQMVSNDVATLLQSDRVSEETASDLNLKDLKGYKVSVSSETTSRVITLTVTGADAAGTANVANKMADNVSSVAQEVMGIKSVNTIDRAATPKAPSGPNRPLYIAVALLAGLFAAVALVVLMDMLNTRVRSQEEVEELLGIPVIGRVPVMGGGIVKYVA